MPNNGRIYLFFVAFVFGVNWGQSYVYNLLIGETPVNGDVPVSQMIKSK